MAKVVDAARVTTRDGAIWRSCTACGRLAPLAPDADTCEAFACAKRKASRKSSLDRRELTALLARPGVLATREVYSRCSSDVLRVAALVEIAAAAAALARTVVKLRGLDPEMLTGFVRDDTDLRAVLGRGRWLPTMTRHVPAPPTGRVPAGALTPVVERRRVRRAALADVTPLFDQDAPIPFAIAEGR